MANAKEIIRVPWCEEAEAAFLSHPDTADDLDSIKHEVQNADAQLWRFTGKATMWLVTRLERYATGQREFVLVNAIGSNSRAVLDVCEQTARKLKADSLRCHVKSAPLMRILQARGWQAERTVYKKAINDVQ